MVNVLLITLCMTARIFAMELPAPVHAPLQVSVPCMPQRPMNPAPERQEKIEKENQEGKQCVTLKMAHGGAYMRIAPELILKLTADQQKMLRELSPERLKWLLLNWFKGQIPDCPSSGEQEFLWSQCLKEFKNGS